jgi:hypothetical protein
MTRGDDAVDRLSRRLAALSESAARRGGLVGKLAPPLADDSEFVAKLKPSLIKARAAGELPETSSPELTPEPEPGWRLADLTARRSSGADAKGSHAADGRSPLLVIGAAAAAGVMFAKLLDWSGHAYPRA